MAPRTNTKLSTKSQDAQLIRMNLISEFLKVEQFLELETPDQLEIIDTYYNYVIKGTTK